MRRTDLAVVGALLILAAFPFQVSAHEQHQVGKYTVEMGWPRLYASRSASAAAQTFEPAIRALADLERTINEMKVDERFETGPRSLRSGHHANESSVPPIGSAAVRAPPASCGRWAIASTRRDGSLCWAQCLPRLRSCFPRSACDARGADRERSAPSSAKVMFRRRWRR